MAPISLDHPSLMDPTTREQLGQSAEGPSIWVNPDILYLSEHYKDKWWKIFPTQTNKPPKTKQKLVSHHVEKSGVSLFNESADIWTKLMCPFNL